MNEAIPAQAWLHNGLLRRRFIIDATVPGDDVTELRIHGAAGGISIHLNAGQLDEIADSFKARAELMRRTAGRAVTR